MRQKLTSEVGKWTYKKRGYTVELVFRKITWNGRKPLMDFHGLVNVRREFSLMCLVHSVKEIVKKVLQDTLTLLIRYSKPIEEIMPGYKEYQLTLVRVVM